jgi:zinc transport system substrate-binding protein
MRNTIRTLRHLAIAVLLAALPAGAVLSAEKLTIYTVNYPLAFFAERLAGDLARVEFPAPPDVDPAFWMPDVDTVAEYQAADLILLNGAGYAHWVDKVSLPASRLVNTSRGFADQYIEASAGVSHSHGPGGEHSHSGTAFTTWLDLDQAARQAEAVAQAIERKRPDAQDRVAKNLETLKAELLALDARLASITAAAPSRPLLASHPVYQYLARRYGLNLRSVLWEPGEAPTPQQWSELERMLKEHPAHWMLWEGQPLPETATRLRTLGVESVVFDPCANRPEKGDFLTVMGENTNSMERVYQK